MGTIIHYRTRTRRRRDIASCVPLKKFAKDNNVHPDTVRYWISTGKVVGFKFSRKWYVRLPSGSDP